MTPVTASVSFDNDTGLATFSGLSINETGMYRLAVNTYTTDAAYNLTCLSKAVEIRNPGEEFATSVEGLPPNYILYFMGDPSLVDFETVLANTYNYMLDYGVKASEMEVTVATDGNIGIYVTFWSDYDSVQLKADLDNVNTKLEADPNVTFIYASINDREQGNKPTTTTTTTQQTPTNKHCLKRQECLEQCKDGDQKCADRCEEKFSQQCENSNPKPFGKNPGEKSPEEKPTKAPKPRKLNLKVF